MSSDTGPDVGSTVLQAPVSLEKLSDTSLSPRKECLGLPKLGDESPENGKAPDSPQPKTDAEPTEKEKSSAAHFYSQEPTAGSSSKEESGSLGGTAVSTVASHYNAIEEIGLKERTKSRIFFMRNFNNWIKSMWIGEYLKKLKAGEVRGVPLRVLDLGCGKGGDLLKWMRGNVSHVVCADVAEVSIQHCEGRYKDMCAKKKAPFTAQFITADCTKERLRNKYKNPSTESMDPTLKFHLVSCQFAFHYCFESLAQANCMLQNAAECLENGGYFIGTIPNAYEIVRRHKAAGSDSFGNEVYNITMDDSAKGYPLFGAMYNFHLHEVVDCPEFLVHFPTLVKLAERHGLKLVDKYTFEQFYSKFGEEGRFLLQKINGLELYPAHRDSVLLGKEEDYAHAAEYLKKNSRVHSIGTLSKPEWEATSLYMMFAFQKIKRQMSLDDFPEASEAKKKRKASESGDKRDKESSDAKKSRKSSDPETSGSGSKRKSSGSAESRDPEESETKKARKSSDPETSGSGSKQKSNGSSESRDPEESEAKKARKSSDPETSGSGSKQKSNGSAESRDPEESEAKKARKSSESDEEKDPEVPETEKKRKSSDGQEKKSPDASETKTSRSEEIQE